MRATVMSKLNAADTGDLQVLSENGNASVLKGDTVFRGHSVSCYLFIQLPALFPIRVKIHYRNFPLSKDRQIEKEFHPHH